MAGFGGPPAGVPDGASGGGDDEYRSVVFDESFVRAARLQESSARERVAENAPAVRPLLPRRGSLSKQALFFIVLIVLAFGTAVYMGVRRPYQGVPTGQSAPRTHMTVIPLAPQDEVQGAADVAQLYAHSPAAHFRSGARGVSLPPARPTAHFSEDQVRNALTTAKTYIVRSALDPDVLGGQVHLVRVLLDADQRDQFDQSFTHPAADGLHAPTGWLVRIDPSRAELAGQIRVQGTLRTEENGPSALEVIADHVLVYALRPAGDDHAKASLFTVRRELHFRFDRNDLRLRQTQLVSSSVRAGPLSCAEDSADYLRPLLAGQKAETGLPADTDLYGVDSVTPLCGSLADTAQPAL